MQYDEYIGNYILPTIIYKVENKMSNGAKRVKLYMQQ